MKRFFNIFKAKANKLAGDLENSEEMLDEVVEKMKDNYHDILIAASEVGAKVKENQRKIDSLKAENESLDKYISGWHPI